MADVEQQNSITSLDVEPRDHPAPALPTAQSSQTLLVWNPFLSEYSGLAPARMQRREGTSECPFCADLTSGRVPSDTQAWIRPNDFPALQPPQGECVILIYSDDHSRSFAQLSVAEVVRIIGLWHQVYRDMAPRYACVMSWETSGAAIGQTQTHPHGQTYGMAVVPDMLAREMAEVQRAESEGRGCPFCAEAHAERAGPRVVLAGEHWVGFVPPYARYPYQVRLTPRQHTSAIVGMPLGSAAATELAGTLLRLVRAYDRAFQAPMPYMLALHQLADPRFHMHLELLPVGRSPGKLKLAASAEMAFGFWMNDSLPETKAAELRELLAQESV